METPGGGGRRTRRELRRSATMATLAEGVRGRQVAQEGPGGPEEWVPPRRRQLGGGLGRGSPWETPSAASRELGLPVETVGAASGEPGFPREKGYACERRDGVPAREPLLRPEPRRCSRWRRARSAGCRAPTASVYPSASPSPCSGVVREQNAHLGEVRGGRARRSMQAMRRIVETDRRCHHGSGDVAGISGSSRRRRPRGP